jgi:hypothetical protein
MRGREFEAARCAPNMLVTSLQMDRTPAENWGTTVDSAAEGSGEPTLVQARGGAAKLTQMCVTSVNGGDDGTRTRDLCRDRAAF